MRDKKSELYLRGCGCAGEREKNRGISTDTLTQKAIQVGSG